MLIWLGWLGWFGWFGWFGWLVWLAWLVWLVWLVWFGWFGWFGWCVVLCACWLRKYLLRLGPSALGGELQRSELVQDFDAPGEELNQIRGPRFVQAVHFEEVRAEAVLFPIRLLPSLAFHLGVVLLQPLDNMRWQLAGETYIAGQGVVLGRQHLFLGFPC